MALLCGGAQEGILVCPEDSVFFYDACENQLQYAGRTRGPEDVKSTVSQMLFYNAKA